MDVEEAVGNFRRTTRHCDNVIAVHRGYGGGERGRRAEEMSLNRAVIVLAVASWQAVIQDYTLACLDLSAPGPGSSIAPATYALIAGRVRKEIADFSTPNAENTRRLLMSAGFDPRPSWTWRQRGGRGRGVETWRPAEADRRINEWLRVRHAIAHGHANLPQVDALQSVRLRPGSPPTDPPLRLSDAERCLAFFRRLARLTSTGLAPHLGVTPPTWR
jgi:hypothetical protein